MNARLSKLSRLLAPQRRIEVKTPGELEAMRVAGRLVARTLRVVSAEARAGVSTAELDELAEETIRQGGGVPSFKGYHGFPGSICTSVNEQIVHGIPSARQVLAQGDLVSVDCGAIVGGWHGDAAVTLCVDPVSESEAALSEATRLAMLAGLDAARSGGRLGDISHAVERETDRVAGLHGREYGMITEYGGHGIGSRMHMEPFVSNVGEPGRGPRLRPGMALAIEPMLTSGSAEPVELGDGWTVVTADRSRAAHWEHTVAVTEDGPWVLTADDET